MAGARALLLTLFATCLAASAVGKTTTTTSKKEGTGRYLIYMPLATKSVTIMLLPVAEAMAARGHEVVVVMADVGVKTKHKNINLITFEDPSAGNF